MQKVLQIIPTLGDGGAERFVVDLANELQRQGSSVTLLVLYDYQATILSSEVEVPIFSLGKAPGLDLRCYIRLARHLLSHDYDVVHSHTRALNYIPLLILIGVRSFFVHTMHNDAIKEEETLIYRIRKALLFKFRLVHPVTISPQSLDSFKSYYNVNSTLITNGTRIPQMPLQDGEVDKIIEHIRASGGQHIFLNVARFSPQKNQLMLFQAFEKLKNSNAHLIIAGRYENTDYYNSIAHHKPNNVHLIGSVSNIGSYLKVCDGFVLGSLWEGMPISLLEAFAAGCVPICTPAGGIPSMLRPDLGFMLSSFEAEDLAQQILRIIKIEITTIKELQQNCRREFLEEYSIQTCASRYLTLYLSKAS